jgi:hypothetical protein
MNIYKLSVANEEYRRLYFTNVNLTTHMADQPRAKPFGSSWQLVSFSHYKPTDEGYSATAVDSDFFSLNFRVGMSPAAAERTSEWFLPYGELLPVKITDDGSTAYWFHCTTLIDALDEQNSVGAIEDDGKMRAPQLHVFFPDKIKGSPIFVIPQLGTGVYCTDHLKSMVESSGLTGLSFDLEWSDEPEGIARIEAWVKKVGGLAFWKERMLKKRAELEAASKRNSGLAQ